MKHCSKCGKDKEDKEFYKQRSFNESYNWCKDCWKGWVRSETKIKYYPNWECQCGKCDKKILIRLYHREEGIPKFIKGHYINLKHPMDGKCKNPPLDYSKIYYYECRCGGIIELKPDHRWGGIPRFIVGHNNRGKNNPAWKGGKTRLGKRIRHSTKYKEWHNAIFVRDNFTDVLTGKRGGDLEVDHYPRTFEQIMIDNHITTYKQAMNCAELWDTNNGRTLTKQHHKELHKKENKHKIYDTDKKRNESKR